MPPPQYRINRINIKSKGKMHGLSWGQKPRFIGISQTFFLYCFPSNIHDHDRHVEIDFTKGKSNLPKYTSIAGKRSLHPIFRRRTKFHHQKQQTSAAPESLNSTIDPSDKTMLSWNEITLPQSPGTKNSIWSHGLSEVLAENGSELYTGSWWADFLPLEFLLLVKHLTGLTDRMLRKIAISQFYSQKRSPVSLS